jgi:hypothetical protein
VPSPADPCVAKPSRPGRTAPLDQTDAVALDVISVVHRGEACPDAPRMPANQFHSQEMRHDQIGLKRQRLVGRLPVTGEFCAAHCCSKRSVAIRTDAPNVRAPKAMPMRSGFSA